MASPTQWTCVWVDSGSWWWTGRLGVLKTMGSQRVGHDWATELNWCTVLTKMLIIGETLCGVYENTLCWNFFCESKTVVKNKIYLTERHQWTTASIFSSIFYYDNIQIYCKVEKNFTVISHILATPFYHLSFTISSIPQYLWGIGSRAPIHTKICECSGSLCKMVSCLHTTYIHPSYTLK